MISNKILSTGSKGNAVIIEDAILIDCGVPFKALQPYIKGLKLVLLTHIHTDHICTSTVKKLAYERPTLRFGCGDWLVPKLVECGVNKANIDVYSMDKQYEYSRFSVVPFQLYHNVTNCGYKVHIGGKRLLYATDTCKIETEAPGYDLYMIEANYDEDELKERIQKKIDAGEEFIYDIGVPDNHLSKKDATEFVMKNAGPNSDFIFMHVHEED